MMIRQIAELPCEVEKKSADFHLLFCFLAWPILTSDSSQRFRRNSAITPQTKHLVANLLIL